MAQVLLLTAADQARDLAFLLEEEGHEPVHLPVLDEIIEVPKGLAAVAEQVQRLTWIVAIGRAPVRAFLSAVNAAGTRTRLGKVQWLASDAATARVVERLGGTVRVPGDGKWTSAVSGFVTAEDDVLVLHEGQVPEILLDALEAAGASCATIEVPVKTTRPQSVAEDAQVVIVHSAAAGEAWAELTLEPVQSAVSESCCGPGEQHTHAHPAVLPVPAQLRVVATCVAAADALAARGVAVHSVASAPTADAIVDAALEAMASRPS